VKISGEVCPHHIALTDESIQDFDTDFKMNPPLRTQRDIDALLEGIGDGTLDILASDHAPHAGFEKEVEFGPRALWDRWAGNRTWPVPPSSRPSAPDDWLAPVDRDADRESSAFVRSEQRHLVVRRAGRCHAIDPELEWTVEARISNRSPRTRPSAAGN
jgi:hypothetical protein